jgi:hypothetical protein
MQEFLSTVDIIEFLTILFADSIVRACALIMFIVTGVYIIVVTHPRVNTHQSNVYYTSQRDIVPQQKNESNDS